MEKKKVLGIFLTLDESLTVKQISELTRFSIEKTEAIFEKLTKEGRIHGKRRFRIRSTNNN